MKKTQEHIEAERNLREVNLSVKHCTVKNKEQRRATDKNGRRSWKDIQGRSIKMKRWKRRRGKFDEWEERSWEGCAWESQDQD